jgi:hypothetical protein
LVHTSSQLLFDFLQPGAHPVTAGFPSKLEFALSGAPTDVGKSKEVECLRFAKSPLGPIFGRKTTELDQASLVRM